MVAASSSSRPSRPGVRAAARSWVVYRPRARSFSSRAPLTTRSFRPWRAQRRSMAATVGIELALVDDQRLVAGAVRLDESVGERHVIAQQQ